jgi:hypothetical protein
MGDLVRISLAKRTFERSYGEKFTSQIFKIRGRIYRENIPVYFLVDIEDEPEKAFVKTWSKYTWIYEAQTVAICTLRIPEVTLE